MATIIIRHKVKDYTAWKRAYDEADWLRKKHGIVFASLHQSEEDPDDVIAVHQFEDMEGAKDFAKEVRGLMKNIGVKGEPVIWFADDVEAVSYG